MTDKPSNASENASESIKDESISAPEIANNTSTGGSDPKPNPPPNSAK